MLDALVLALITNNPNLLIPHFLIHSYLYYVKDHPVITDGCFDEIVKRLGSEWPSLRHRHKRRIDRSLLKTGYYLKYPLIVRGAAAELLEIEGNLKPA